VEETFEARSEKLNQLFHEYYRVPVHRKQLGDATFAVWKDPADLIAMYLRRHDELLALDQYYAQVSRAKDSTWSDDAIFCRAVLQVLLTALNPEESTERNGISVIGQFLESSSAAHLENTTRLKMEDAYFKSQKGYFTSRMTFEENATISLAIYQSQLHVKLKEYADAIEILEGVAKRYPDNGYAEFLSGQTEAIKELKASKPALLEQWRLF
jgi:hypothetical protein